MSTQGLTKCKCMGKKPVNLHTIYVVPAKYNCGNVVGPHRVYTPANMTLFAMFVLYFSLKLGTSLFRNPCQDFKMAKIEDG